MRIGIFEGKKKRYNHLILKTLFENGPLKPWKIAQKISGGSMDKTQDVYGDLIRKRTGRLQELEKKGYVKITQNSFYYDDFKGMMAILVYEEKLPTLAPFYFDILSRFRVPAKVRIPLLNIEVEGQTLQKQIQKIAHSLSNKETLLALRDRLKKLIEVGIDFDVVSNQTLLFWIVQSEIENADEKQLKELFEP